MGYRTMKIKKICLLTLALLATSALAMGDMPTTTTVVTGGNSCSVSFTPVSSTEIKGCYEGMRNGQMVQSCASLPTQANLAGIAAKLQDGRDCSRITVTGV